MLRIYQDRLTAHYLALVKYTPAEKNIKWQTTPKADVLCLTEPSDRSASRKTSKLKDHTIHLHTKKGAAEYIGSTVNISRQQGWGNRDCLRQSISLTLFD
jgi:hypothetical protein